MPFIKKLSNPSSLKLSSLVMSTNAMSLRVKIKGYAPHMVEFYGQFAKRSALALGFQASIVRQPSDIKRWTVLKSPFKYKRAQETFELKTSQREIKVFQASSDGVDKYLLYINSCCPRGITIESTRYETQHRISETTKKFAEPSIWKPLFVNKDFLEKVREIK